MNSLSLFLQRGLIPRMTALSENTYLASIRAGMVSVVPLTILGGLFMVVAYLPIAGWEARMAPHLPLLQIPVTATFGLLGLFVCLAIAYDLGTRLKQEAILSASQAALVFLLIQLEMKDQSLVMEGLGSKGLFTAILIAMVTVRIQKAFTDAHWVIRLPESVPKVVSDTFVSLVYAFLVTLLWSVGINGDNTLDAFVAPIFLQFLAENVEAVGRGQPMPYVTANGFFSTFVNVGGTGATLGLALILAVSKDPAYRKISRLSLPTQCFQINEPIFFGIPIVLNPWFMVPYVANALLLTASTYCLMDWGWIRKPFVNVPWTTPPVIGHYLLTGGDWRAAVWGVVSLGLAMVVYWPFAKAAERQRLAAAPSPSSTGVEPREETALGREQQP